MSNNSKGRSELFNLYISNSGYSGEEMKFEILLTGKNVFRLLNECQKRDFKVINAHRNILPHWKRESVYGLVEGSMESIEKWFDEPVYDFSNEGELLSYNIFEEKT